MSAAAAPDVRVLVVGEVRMYREGLAKALAAEEGVAVTGTLERLPADAAELEALAPDVVLLDVSSPEALPAVRRVTASVPGLRVVALGVTDGDHQVVACAEAGVSGYVTRDQSVDHVIAAVRAAAFTIP